MTCLGDVVAALVDGELDHAARERAQRHLAHCTACRAEVDAQRRLKARLTGVSVDPSPSDALNARLLGLRPPVEGALAPSRPAAVRPVGLRPMSQRPAAGPASSRPGGRRRGRRVAVGSALALLGLTAALALGGPQATRPSTPVDPGTDAFVADFVSTTSDSGSVGGGR